MVSLSGFESFKVTLLVMFFYGLAITLIVYATPEDARSYPQSFSSGVSSSAMDYDTVASTVQGSLESQKNIPVVEVGALVFYSGNILLDLMVNFVTAIPQLIVLILNGVLLLFSGGMDAWMMGALEGFIFAALITFYAISLIEILISVRSGRVI